MANANYRTIPALLEKRASFTGNSMSARWFHQHDLMHGHIERGRLDADEASVLFQAEEWALRAGVDLFVVYSYGTPIAWALDASGPAYVTDQRFSSTTSRQQNLARAHLLTGSDRDALVTA